MQNKSSITALLATAVVGAAALAPAAFAQEGPTASASFINASGENVGTAELMETPNGVLISTDITGLPAGMHGFHVHETGECNAEGGFESAGGHYAHASSQHGFKVEGGPHAGDMPNQYVGEDGVLKAEAVNDRITLTDGEGTLFDADGSALVIHAGADDYESQPSGEAGDRIACAVIEKN